MSSPNRIAVHVHAWGEVRHPEGDITVDREYWRSMKDSFERFTQDRHPPVLRQHTRDGLGWGVVEELTTAEEGTGLPIENEIDKPGIWAVVQMSDPLYELWSDGLVTDWSPGIAEEFEDRHTDEKYQNLLRELSFVSLGHQHNTHTPTPVYTLSDDGFIPTMMEDVMPQDTQENQETDQVLSAVQTLAEQVASLRDTLEPLMDELGGSEMKDDDEDESEMSDEEPAGAEMSDDDDTSEVPESVDQQMSDQAKRIRQLEEKLAETEQERTRESARAEINERGIDLEDDERDDLVELACSDEDAFRATLNVMQRQQERAAEESQTAADEGRRFNFSEVGAVGQTDTDASGQIKKMTDKIAADIELEDEKKARKVARKRLQNKGLNWGDPEQARAGREALDEYYPNG